MDPKFLQNQMYFGGPSKNEFTLEWNSLPSEKTNEMTIDELIRDRVRSSSAAEIHSSAVARLPYCPAKLNKTLQNAALKSSIHFT